MAKKQNIALLLKELNETTRRLCNSVKVQIPNIQFDHQHSAYKEKNSLIVGDQKIEIIFNCKKLNSNIRGEIDFYCEINPSSKILEKSEVQLCLIFNNSKEYRQYWHFDTHQDQPSATDNNIHPLYHWQLGGNEWDKWKDENNDDGLFLIIGEPRHFHPPMDLNTLVDFMLCHYVLQDRSELKNEPLYWESLKWSQNTFWKPYFESISAQFTGEPTHYSGVDLLPSLT